MSDAEAAERAPRVKGKVRRTCRHIIGYRLIGCLCCFLTLRSTAGIEVALQVAVRSAGGCNCGLMTPVRQQRRQAAAIFSTSSPRLRQSIMHRNWVGTGTARLAEAMG